MPGHLREVSSGVTGLSQKTYHPPPLISYLPYLSLLRSLFRQHADSCLPAPTTDPATRPPSSNIDPLSPRDHVLLKELQPRSLEPWWPGPHTVTLTTLTAAKLLGHQCWYHLTRLKCAPPHDARSFEPLGPTRIHLHCQPSVSPSPPHPSLISK